MEAMYYCGSQAGQIHPVPLPTTSPTDLFITMLHFALHQRVHLAVKDGPGVLRKVGTQMACIL